MERYTIYCTEEQTKKALELGAPIPNHKLAGHYEENLPKNWFYKDGKCYQKTTAEQMIGWLEERGIYIDITNSCGVTPQGGNYHLSSCEFNEHGYSDKKHPYPTRKEATLAAIDSALDYLIKNKK